MLSRRRPQHRWITTFAPAAASARAVAAPMPRALPVTSATCPARSFMTSSI